MGEPLRVSGAGEGVGQCESRVEHAAELSSAVEAVARLRERIGHRVVEDATALELCDSFACVRRLAMDDRDLTLAEIGFSGELVFAALARRPAALAETELAFLDNVIAAMRELVSAPMVERGPVSLALIGDAFESLLTRLELA